MSLSNHLVGMHYRYPDHYEVEREKIREYAEAVKNDDASFFEEKAAAELGYDGLLAPLIRTFILPNIALFAGLTKYMELGLGIVLLLGALEVGRRRLSGRVGAERGYEAPVALIAAFAGLAAAGLSLSIALLMGEQLPTITPGRALTTAIPVELLLVPLGIAVAWMEAGRFRVLHKAH